MGRAHRWNAKAFLRLNSFGTVRHHQDVNFLSFTGFSPFVCGRVPLLFQGNKKPCLLSVSRVGEKFYSIFRTCLLPVYPNDLPGTSQSVPRILQGETQRPGYTGFDVPLSRLASSANSWLICSCRFSSNVYDDYYKTIVTVHLYLSGLNYFEFKYSDYLMGECLWLMEHDRYERGG